MRANETAQPPMDLLADAPRIASDGPPCSWTCGARNAGILTFTTGPQPRALPQVFHAAGFHPGR